MKKKKVKKLPRLDKEEAPIIFQLWQWWLERHRQYTFLFHTADKTSRQRRAIAKRLVKQGWVKEGHMKTYMLTNEAIDFLQSKKIPVGYGSFVEQLQGDWEEESIELF